jgi:acetylornithine deacetylase/succinyl-diaminopimelate desuccinylase-like protein
MPGVELLSTLLQVDSTNPPGNEGPAAELLQERLSNAGFLTHIFVSPGGRPNLVARLDGLKDRPALVLLSHTDVVGVEPEQWRHAPFGGEVHDGFMWGRGALDMKGIAVMHAEAAAVLGESGTAPRRDVIVVAVADEEAGGAEGAEWLLDRHPRAVGFDEGRPPPEVLGEGGFGLSGLIEGHPVMPIVLGEKTALWLRLVAKGDPGHGSLPPARNALRNLMRAMTKLSGYRTPRIHPVMRQQLDALARASGGNRRRVLAALASGAGPVVARVLARQLRSAGMVGALLADTVTPTLVNAGYTHNVVPGSASGALDCRLLPDTNPQEFVTSTKRTAGKYGVTVETIGLNRSPVSDRGAFFALARELSERVAPDAVVVPSLTTGTTDVRAFRKRGATGYGWVPLVLTPELLATIHGHDERVEVKGFERAVELMTEAVRRSCS